MNFWKKSKVVASFVLCTAVTIMSTAYADALDNCRQVIMSDTYTIKYQNLTPPTRAAMKEKQIMMDKIDFIDTNPYTMYQPINGVVTAKGTTYYIETNSMMRMPNISITYGMAGLISKLAEINKDEEEKEREYEYATCKLVKNDKEQFLFTRIKEKDKIQYTGKKKGKVAATKIKRNFDASYPYDFGDREVTRLLNAIMPNDKKIEGTVIYERVKSGTLPDGLYYVDLKAINPGKNAIFDAIRYYFSGNKLVKIESGQYYKTVEGKLDGTRSIINITEFKNTAEENYFKLPEGLEDVTKRDETDSTGGSKK